MKALAVIDKNRALGYKNNLLFHLPTDLAHFKKNTIGKTVVMGQKTLESMPKGRPLPGRNTLVLNNEAPSIRLADLDGGFVAERFNSLKEFWTYVDAHNLKEELVVSGGASIYSLLLEDCDELVITEVNAEAPVADVWFPEYKDKFSLYKEEGPFYDGDLEYFIRYYKK